MFHSGTKWLATAKWNEDGSCFIWKGGIMKRTCGAWSTFCACELCSSSIKIYEARLTAYEAKPLQASCFFAFGKKAKKMVARTRIELVTQGFSVLCSTYWATPPLSRLTNPLSCLMSLMYHHFMDCQAENQKKSKNKWFFKIDGNFTEVLRWRFNGWKSLISLYKWG